MAVRVAGSTGEIGASTATSLALALTELVHNALEHAFEPGAPGTVTVDARREGDTLTLVVRDDGRGLAPGVDLTTSRGLGFSIVRTLVEEDLRGTLATNDTDGGTSITISVPLRTRRGLRPRPDQGALRARMRVLIAEDEALIRMDLREMLEEEGHEVVGEARDGAEAIALARSTTPDLVFMDVKMPNVDGIQAARTISDEAIAPVVMLTAFSQAGLVEEAAQAGAMGYVVKPFSRDDLRPAMQVAVSRYAEMRLLAQQVGDLEERLETRKLLDRAKGILMKGGVSEPEAFKRLQKLAMDKRRSLRDVAEAVITADELKGYGGVAAAPTPRFPCPAGGECATLRAAQRRAQQSREQRCSPVLGDRGAFLMPRRPRDEMTRRRRVERTEARHDHQRLQPHRDARSRDPLHPADPRLHPALHRRHRHRWLHGGRRLRNPRLSHRGVAHAAAQRPPRGGAARPRPSSFERRADAAASSEGAIAGDSSPDPLFADSHWLHTASFEHARETRT